LAPLGENDEWYVDKTTVIGVYDWVIINALGEGLINVCNEGGNIAAGDYLCSSSIPGKAMRQRKGSGSAPDPDYHNYTIAKAREAAAWATGDNSIKNIACFYCAG